MFVLLSEPPPDVIIFVTARELTCQAYGHVEDAGNCNKQELEKEPSHFLQAAHILPVRPLIVNNLVEDGLAFRTRHKLQIENDKNKNLLDIKVAEYVVLLKAVLVQR